MLTLQTPCFWIEHGSVREGVLQDWMSLVPTTSRPDGGGYQYYATTVARTIDAVLDDDDHEIEPERVEDAWVVAEWATWAGPQVVVQQCDSEAEARAAVEQIYVHAILDSEEQIIHLQRSDAEQALLDSAE